MPDIRSALEPDTGHLSGGARGGPGSDGMLLTIDRGSKQHVGVGMEGVVLRGGALKPIVGGQVANLSISPPASVLPER